MSRDGRPGRRWNEFVPGQAPLFTRDRLIIVGIVLMLAFFGYLTERQLHRADAAGAAAAARATDPSMALYTPAAPVIVPEILPTEALPSGVPTIAASDLPPPPPVPPQAVLKAEGDSVLAAPEPSPMPAPKRKPGPVLIFDAGASSDAAEPEGARVLSYSRPAPAGQASGKDVALLTRGTLIPAVLESVIDTRQPGGVRAMVSTDVRSADGARLLVPRSSRLIGQYRRGEGSASGRAYVVWTRIDRPDGSRIPLASAGKDASAFRTSYDGAPVVSQVGGAGQDAVRVRQGEPIRVVTTRSVALPAGQR